MVAKPEHPYKADRNLKKRQAQDKLVALLSQGVPLAAACKEVGRTNQAYRDWRRDKVFAAKVDQCRLNAQDRSMQSYDFVDFRQTYFNRATAAHHYRMMTAIEEAEPDSLTLILAHPESAKGLALDTPLPTPTGWTTQGDVEVGDWLLDDRGEPCQVTAVSEDHHRPCYRLSFTGGEEIVADDEHLWFARTRTMRSGRAKPRVVSTAELAERPIAYDRPNHGVPMARPLNLADRDFTIDPYVLGAWLGDGSSSAGMIWSSREDVDEMAANLAACGENPVIGTTTACPSIRLASLPGYCPRGHDRLPSGPASCATCSAQHYRLQAYGEPMTPYTHSSLKSRLVEAGLVHNKHVPPAYLRASYKQRLALLQGLMDTDGSALARGYASFTTTSPEIADGLAELLNTLGLKFGRFLGRATLYGKDCGPVHRFTFWPGEQQAFRLARKAARMKPPAPNDRRHWRMVRDIVPVPTVTTRCIAVDSPNRLYLAGRSMVPTHNTSVMVDYVNYKLGPVDPNYRIVAITEGQDLARKIVSQVTTRMVDDNQFAAYISRYGPFKAPDRSLQKPWNSEYVCLVQSKRDEKEPNLEAKGWGSKLYGGRYDLVWMDDIQTSETLNQTPQLLRYIRQTVLTRPAKGIGKTVVTGSSVGDNDIYATLQDEEMVDNLVIIPALSKWLAKDEHFVKKGKEVRLAEGCPELSAWPDYWSMLDLAKRRSKVGEEIWTRTYMLREVYEASKTFNVGLIDGCKDPSRGLGRNGLGLDAVCSVDPALGSGIAGFMAAAYSTEKMWVLDAAQRTNLYRNEDILAIIAAWSAVYRPSVWIVEENNFQKGLARDERLLALAAKFGFRVKSHETQRNKNDPVIGVSMMASAFSDQEMSLPWGDDPAQQAMRAVCNELLAWRPKKRGTELKQNLVMAMWFIWLHWEAERSRLTRASAPVRQQRPSWLRSA